MKRTFILFLFLTLMGFAVHPVTASAGEWGLGIGVAAQRPPQQGTDTQVVVLPFPSYQGERLSLGFGSVGYALTKSDRFRIAAEGQLRFDGYDPDDSEALSGLEQRDLTLDAGFSITSNNEWGIASLKVMGDALGVHDGYEISASYQYPLQFERWTIVPSIAANWPSDELVEYFYGVTLAEATADRPAYNGKSVLNVSAGLNLLYQLTDNWEVIGGGEVTRLGDGITDSPIINREHEVIAYTAIVYRF